MSQAPQAPQASQASQTHTAPHTDTSAPDVQAQAAQDHLRAACAGEAPCCALADVPIGGCCQVRRHHATGAIRQRLLDLGFVPGAQVCVRRVATLGDPIQLGVNGYAVSLRKSEALTIEVNHG